MNPPAGDPPIYVHRIAADDRIEFVNDAWIQFAEQNGTPRLPREVLGTPLWQHIAGREVLHLSQQLLAKVRKTNVEVSLPFRCDSPAVRRFMRMRIVPLPARLVEFGTWVEREEPYARPVPLLDPAVARDKYKHLRMCAWCKRIDTDGSWLELDRAIEEQRLFDSRLLPEISHSICEDCLERIET